MSVIKAEAVVDYLRKNEINSLANSTTSGKIAEAMKTDRKNVSWALSSQFKNGKTTVLRRAKAAEGKGWVFWVGGRAATGKVLRTRKSKGKKRKLAPGIGIYLCRENNEDVLLTFKEAEALYNQLKVVFGG